MKLSLPIFRQNSQYTELRGDDLRSGGEYRFILEDDISIPISSLKKESLLGVTISLRDAYRTEWAQVKGGRLTIRKGYAWNGASPKKWAFCRWWGTPDFKATRLATLVHDVCFQFLRVSDFPLTILECNQLFYDIMKTKNFKLANIYFGAVEDFGERFAGKYPRKGEHSLIIEEGGE